MTGYNFSERVRRVLAVSREEAVQLHHASVDTEHILLGIVAERDGVAIAVLQNLGIKVDAVRRQVFALIRVGSPDRATGPDLPHTSRARKVLELAISEAQKFGHGYVGTEHLLLGLICEETGIGTQILAQAGLTLDAARVETLRILAETPTTDP